MDTPRPQLLDFQFHQNNDSFTLHFQQRLILTHSKMDWLRYSGYRYVPR